MQARAHGLVPPPLCSPEGSARPIKQEPMLSDCDTPTEAHMMTSDPAAYGVMAKTTGAKLDDMLMEETPLPLTTSLSPKNSNSSSSVSMEENERTC